MSKVQAERKAQEVLNQVGRSLPIDVYAIARIYDVDIRSQDLEDSVSGLLVIKDGHAIIGVNEHHHPNRQRFTIAHELGHFLLHRKAASVFIDESSIFYRNRDSADGSKRQEIEANTFAATLLMPESLLREHTKNEPIDFSDEVAIKRLATQFEVSTQALAIRLTQLELILG